MIANLSREQTTKLAIILRSQDRETNLTISDIDQFKGELEVYAGGWRAIHLYNGDQTYLLDIWGYMWPTPRQKEAAFKRGQRAGRQAGEWAAHGNTSQETLRAILTAVNEGDPELYDMLPREPELSGEWSDDLTPIALASDILDLDSGVIDDTAIDELSEAWEDGVQDTFVPACVATVKRFLTDQEG